MAPNSGSPDAAAAAAPSPSPVRTCATCGQPLYGHVVRGLDGTHHVECFRCMDCGVVVASKFFPGRGPGGQPRPLCETDYFRRLDLLCGKCGAALRGAFIQAFGKKFHENHFQCSLCSKVFKKDDSIYERNGAIFCQFHYAMLYASKCGSCRTAVLRRFIEVTRNGNTEQWHLDCYHIYQSWSARMVPKNLVSAADVEEPANEEALQVEQQSIQQRTARIVQVLGAFEESAADSIAQTVFACADGNANECVNQTARFLNHVDSLFQAIDDVETKLSSYGDHRVLQHDREPKDLSKQLVALFTLLSAMNPDTALSSRTIVTELARLLKYMITVGLRGAIKLDRMSASTAGLERFLDLLETATGPVPPARPPSPVDGSRVRLPATFPSTDLKNESCTVCQLPVEEDCIKHGPLRWHGKCFSCAGCGKSQCLDVASAALEPSTRRVFCASCAASKPGLIPGFESVSQLQQYVFLLRLGLSRLCNVFNERGPAAAADAAGRLTPTSLDPQGLVRRSSRKSRSVSGLDQILEPSSELTRSHRATPSVSPQAGGLRGRSPRPGENKVSPQQPQPLAPEAQQSVDLAAELDEKFARINLEIDQAEVDGDGSSDDERGISIPGPGQSLPAMVPPPYEKPAIQVLGGQRFLSELSPLDVVTLRSAVVPQLAFLLDPFMDLDQLLDMIEGKRNTIWDKIVSSFKVPDKKKVKEGTFGVPLQELIAAHGVRTDLNPGPGSVVIPRFIDATIRSMRSQDLRVEGIFRKNGNIRRLKATVEELDRDGDNVACLQGENVVQLAALLRRFLRDMPDPLMTFDLFKIFTTSQRMNDESQRKKVLHYAFCLLPKSNRDVLEVILAFLKFVASYAGRNKDEPGNRMDLENLATVVAPNILYPRPKDSGKGKETVGVAEDAFLAISAVRMLMEYLDEFVLVPPEFERNIIVGSSDVAGRDLGRRGDVRFSAGNGAGSTLDALEAR